ncbi:MAG: flagellar M-ring protein FliF [Zetaproteobacteria bacterium CG06_land_8_20_14_3_00_59_53]|nr:MAG: flagellar M-ring protein FliF [Zetaproteobacteria bacterium CG2_30_59_37]PIO90767.1 MAG: flagellar M-ring protein FliF [Zetaproteobacteria bacterium CG23_combo_of_CG06-09_8_20_14_all_59_86]PIQ65339.1 MAG: flagellar M-ring protein FliF [Zetaproteobacteria bacterium CG11_big_fil_rev_8_21_14_0_20_59_439]PIU69881.1 MAG: flagellar M-ring protein FliF [Zetaproteobacteria bacterium CG06_land_8_20_14_3_00_59_53]PIU97407.1 MAG: flagellar M-ring protein FliF [Zetaproteobacteria bacterium CG03_lan
MANDMLPASRSGQNGTLTPMPEVTDSGEQAMPAGFNKASFGTLLSQNRKLLLFAASGLMLAGFLSMVLWSAKTPYQTLYAGMDAKSAASVVEYLQKERIPYQLQGEGTVMVPADQVYAARLKLAGQDIAPGGDSGFELFDKKAEFGISDFAQQVNYQRAMQGELARTIEVLPMVSTARVHIVLARESAFADRKRESSASVMLKLTGSQKMNRENVSAIQNLVAASVPGLDPAAVTIVDAGGNLLSRDEEQAALGAGQSLQETQSRIEQRLETRITGMLEQVVGEGQAVVRVTAMLNRQMSEQNSKQFNPDGQVVRSQKEASENRSSTDSTAQGVPGTASNTPGANPATAQAAASPKDSASRNESTVNYEISSITEHKVIPSGGITKISVAAIVGGSFATPGDAASFQPRSKTELKTLQGLIEKAIGFDEDRGDSVEIQSLPLLDITSTQDEEALSAQENKAFYLELARYGLAGLAMLLLAFFILRPLARLIGSDPESKKKEAEEKAANASLQTLSPAAFAHLESMQQARHAIQHQPERAGKIVREWVEQV